MSLKDAMNAKKKRSSTQKEAAIQEVTKEPMKRLNVNIAESKLMDFKAKAAKDKSDMSTLIHQWISDYLEK